LRSPPVVAKELIGKINVKKDGLKEEFAKIKREIGTDTINPDNFLTLNRQIDTSRLKLLEIDKSEKRRKEWQDDLLKRLSDLDNLWHEEYQLLEKEVNRINEAESKLSIAVEFKGRRDKFTDKMKQIFRGSGIRETAYQEVETTYKDFIQIYKDSSKLNTILNENQVVDFKRRFTENLEDLLTFKVDNKIVIQYNGKSLDKHSLGQRASALILFLLAQKENDVLVIDQPEDDLDNQTIYDEVIKELKKIANYITEKKFINKNFDDDNNIKTAPKSKVKFIKQLMSKENGDVDADNWTDYDKLKQIISKIPANEISEDIVKMYEFIKSKVESN
jgi:hypothetical protein